MYNPTRTTNRLHFEDLDPHRFEDLGAELLYRKQDWKRFNNWGRSGSDDGIDISCEEDNGVRWFCQCKRYQTISTSEIKAAVDKIVSKNENCKDDVSSTVFNSFCKVNDCCEGDRKDENQLIN